MADARLIIHHHRDDRHWARRVQRVAGAYPGLQVIQAGASAALEGDGTAPLHIHICSPAYAATPRALDWGEHVALIVAGEPGASAFEGAMDEECLPPALTKVRRVEARSDRRADGASPEAIACLVVAMALGLDLAIIRQLARRQRSRRTLYGCLGAFGIVALVLGGIAVQNYLHTADRTLVSAGAVSAAVVALDAGDDGAVYASLATALDAGGALSDRGAAVVERAMHETRLLADFPSPSADLNGLSFLPGGVIAATSENGGAWLVDPGAGATTQISAPSPGVVARLSPTGDRLWTARPGKPQQDETGAPYAPLTFIDVDLAQGEVVTETVIRAPVVHLSDGAISPDGALFAADIGPGAGAETLVAVFRRGEQALAGVLRLPSDSAVVQFVGPDRILATITPPSEYGQSPGLYLWQVGEAAPVILWREGQPPVCPVGGGQTDADVIRDRQAAGDLLAPQVLTAPSGREVALLLPGLERGACLLRWQAPMGTALETINVPGRAIGAEVLAEGGPYLIRRKGRAATVLRPGARATTLAPCRTGAVLPLSPPGGRAEAFLCGEGGDGVVASASGAVWRRLMHEGGVTVAAPGPGGRLVTTGRDGRIRLWDGAPRDKRGPRDLREVLSFHVVPAAEGMPHVAAVYPNGLIRVLDADGAETHKAIQTEVTAPQLRSFAPNSVVVMGQRSGGKYWQSVNVLTGEVGRGAGHAPSAHFLSRGPIINAGRWTQRMFATDDGTAHVMFHAMDRTRRLLDLDLVNGATAKVEREGETAIWVNLSGRGTAQDMKFEGRGGAVRLSPTGEIAILRIEAASPPHDDEFHVLDVGSGRAIRVFGAPTVSGWFDFSASGDTFAIRPLDPTADVPIFDADYGRKIGAAPGGRAHPVWAPSGDVLATGSAGRVTVTEVSGGLARTRCVRASTPSRYLAFAPDGGADDAQSGGALITAARAGGVSVLDPATCTVRLRVPDLRVTAAPFAPHRDTIWVPTEMGASILSLAGDASDMADTIKRRARALAATR